MSVELYLQTNLDNAVITLWITIKSGVGWIEPLAKTAVAFMQAYGNINLSSIERIVD